ncbi:helix-turn-helix transcriptional regulator [Breoghania sp. L-A4]|uniref:helix-turn-helix transcriptional regulator n=1 Tax=Breoghania sp. L-A4 TaxID=2304600 RepID=UPI000E35D29E|nr:helix-turn-helix transcriptional regulator [Breoghania sp. L-A4]AXS41260.1 helix-turn-helix domain-containing protein [Breoghania sp. L-A4]
MSQLQPISPSLPLYLTTRELADLLRVKERKVYDLVATGDVPHSRATGKLLFPREAVLAWIEHAGSGTQGFAEDLPNVVLGSHDPLLEWALRESGSGLASLFDGSFDGLERLAERDGVAAGVHIPEDAPESGGETGWNVSTVAERFGYRPVALVEWAWRERGLIVARGNPVGLEGVADLRRARVVQRQPKAGSQKLLERLLASAGHDAGPSSGVVARDERDAALAVLDGRGDAALGLAAVAHQFQLDFVPLCRERYDLLVWRKAWFEPPMQRLFDFCRTPAFAAMAESLGGYDVSGLGRVHFNGL